MIGETIKWKVKIVNKTGGIRLGIGLKTFLKYKSFLVDNNFKDYDKHGCYVVNSIGFTYTYLEK